MHEWLSDAVERFRKTSRGGALPDKEIALEVPEEVETLEEGAGRGLLLKSVTMIEYTLIIACISLVIAVAGPPVAEAVQGQFNKVAEVISNGSTGGTGGGSDFPGGGSGGGGDQGGTGGGDHGGGNGGNQGGSGGSGNTESDKDKDGIPDNEDAYPDDPLNGTGDKDGDGIADKDDRYPDDPLNGKPAEKKMAGTITMSDCTVGLTSTVVATGTPTDAQIVYQWYVDGKADTTGASRAFTAADANKSVYVAASDATGEYKGQIATAIQRVQTREMKGQVSFGDLVVGKTASANVSGAPSGAQIAYKWYADGVIVSSEQTFTPAAEHVGKSVYVEVTDKGGVFTGSVASATKTVVEDGASKPAENILTGSLSIGDCVVGLTTTAFAADVPTDAQLAYEWEIGGAATGGRTHEFTLDEANAEVRVTAVDGSGKYSGKLYSNVVRVKTRSITGMVSFAEAIVDKDLSAILNGVPTDIAAKDLKYSWTLNGAEVGTDASYTPKTDDIGGVLVLEVKDGSGKYAGSLISQSQIVRAKSASEGGSGGEEGTPLTGTIEIANAYPGITASVVVTDVPVDAALQYRWTLDWETMSTDLTYSIPKDAEGKRLGVIATDSSGKYSDQLFASAVVEKMKMTGTVSIAGSVNAGSTVNASVSGAPSDVVKEFVWKIDGNKAGTGSSFKIPDNAFSKTITVEASDSSGKYSGTITSNVNTIDVHEKASSWTVVELNHIAKDISKNSTSSKYYSDANKAMLNQTKWSAKMSDGKTMKYQIIGINHDNRADGSGKAGFTLQASEVIYTGKTNNSAYLTDGWASSDLRAHLNADFINSMPAELKSSVTEVTKEYDGSNGKIKTTSDKAFLPSSMEVWGSWQGQTNTGTQYELFASFGTTESKFIKNNASGEGEIWLLRDCRYSDEVYCVTSYGSYEITDVTYDLGYAPCFSIG